MGVAQKPPGSVPDTEEVTPQTAVSEELVAMMTNPNVEQQESNATEQHTPHDVGTSETTSALHGPSVNHAVGLAPLGSNSKFGIAPLGPPPISRFGASPLGLGTPISAQMPPPEFYSSEFFSKLATATTPLPPSAMPEDALAHTSAPGANDDHSSATHDADADRTTAPFDAPTAVVAEHSSTSDDANADRTTAPFDALAAVVAEHSLASGQNPDDSFDDNAKASSARVEVATTVSTPSAPSFPLASTPHGVDEPPPDSGWGTERPAATAEGLSDAGDSETTLLLAAKSFTASTSASATYEPSGARVSDDPGARWSSSEAAEAAMDEGGTWSQVPLEAAQFSPERTTLDEFVTQHEAVAQDEPAPPASGEVLMNSAASGVVQPTSPATIEWSGASATRGATLPGIDLDSAAIAAAEAIATPIYLSAAQSVAKFTELATAEPREITSRTAEFAAADPQRETTPKPAEQVRETTPEPFARAKTGRTQPPPLPANGPSKAVDEFESGAAKADAASEISSANSEPPVANQIAARSQPAAANVASLSANHVASRSQPAAANVASLSANPVASRSQPAANVASRSQPAAANVASPSKQVITPVTRSVPPATSAVAEVEPALVAKSRRSKIVLGLWALTLIGAFVGGWQFAGKTNQRKLVAASSNLNTQVLAARESGRAEAIAAIPPPPALLDLSVPVGSKSISDILKTEPSKRTKAEALALGRQWQSKHFDEFAQLSTEIRQNPARLDDFKVRVAVLEFVQDRLTSRAALELLAEISSPRALDLLYSVWTGSKERNETTQLAEALLLSQEVRPQVSGALELALALREKPTQCGAIQQLVAKAIREGDRRSANQLVATSARRNCGDDGTTDCVKCLDDVREMRKAIRASATRPEPTP